MVIHPRIQDQFGGPGIKAGGVSNIKYIYIKIYAVMNYGSRTLFRPLHNSVLELFNMIIFL